jgi:hypothetical protein
MPFYIEAEADCYSSCRSHRNLRSYVIRFLWYILSWFETLLTCIILTPFSTPIISGKRIGTQNTVTNKLHPCLYDFHVYHSKIVYLSSISWSITSPTLSTLSSLHTLSLFSLSPLSHSLLSLTLSSLSLSPLSLTLYLRCL